MSLRRAFWLALFAVLLALLAAGCEKPGEGAKAEEGFNTARPIIASLNNYKEGTDHYPSDLEALVPVYLTLVPKGPDGQSFEYRSPLPGGTYTLTFRYAGPGMNVCTYTPEARWRCFGYY